MVDTLPFLQITVLGEAGSGKTSLINSFVNNGCSKDYTPTLFPE
jgi:GTPase SAR1 family protein